MKKLLFAAILCSLWSCQDGGLTSPTVELGTTVSNSNEPTSTESEPVNEESCFESLGISRSRITHRVVGTTLYSYVPATNADYVNVWTPSINDTLLGSGPVNQEFAVSLPGEGEFKITLAIERRTDTGVCQYDGHSFTVTSNTPPPPRTPDPDPDPDCEQVYIIDQQAYDETILITDKEAYDEEVETCVPQDPLPGEDINIGWAYKMTGDSNKKTAACTGGQFSPVGVRLDVECQPGHGDTDACVFSTNPGDDDFEREVSNKDIRFRLECLLTAPGQPIPQPDVCTIEVIHHEAITHEEVIHHDEVGHFEEICSE